MYVALTRARDHLAVTHPFNVYQSRRGADYSLSQLSRFIDRGVVRMFQQVVLESTEKVPGAEVPTAAPVVDLRAIMQRRFSP